MLKTAKDAKGTIFEFTLDTVIEEGLFNSDGKLVFGRRMEGNK